MYQNFLLEIDTLYYKTLQLSRKAESYFQDIESTFSFDTRQSMSDNSQHLTEPK